MIDEIKRNLSPPLPPEVVNKLLDCYIQLKEDYYLGKNRSASLEAGRLAEIGLRIIQREIDGIYTGVDDRLPNFHDEVVRFGRAPTTHSDTIRFHIPRALEVIHDIRNKRDVGHPKGEIDANYSDATLSLQTSSWVLAELIRVYYTGDMDEAQKIVDELVKFQIPVIQDFDGFLKILNPKLKYPQEILLWALSRKTEGITVEDIEKWSKNKHKHSYTNLALKRLEEERKFLHSENGRYSITHTGIIEVSRKIPLVIEQ